MFYMPYDFMQGLFYKMICMSCSMPIVIVIFVFIYIVISLLCLYIHLIDICRLIVFVILTLNKILLFLYS